MKQIFRHLHGKDRQRDFCLPMNGNMHLSDQCHLFCNVFLPVFRRIENVNTPRPNMQQSFQGMELPALRCMVGFHASKLQQNWRADFVPRSSSLGIKMVGCSCTVCTILTYIYSGIEQDHHLYRNVSIYLLIQGYRIGRSCVYIHMYVYLLVCMYVYLQYMGNSLLNLGLGHALQHILH